MNADERNENSYRSLLLLEEIAKEEPLSQRDLSKRLGIAVGLVNSYIKNFVAKGYLRVKSFPRNRYMYLLTPKGLAEKTRLTYRHLHYFTNLYTTVRKDFKDLFQMLQRSGVERVVFCGVDEVAEIAYLSLQETGLELAGVFDGTGRDRPFLGRSVRPMEEIASCRFDSVVITSLKRHEELAACLARCGVDGGIVFSVREEPFSPEEDGPR